MDVNLNTCPQEHELLKIILEFILGVIWPVTIIIIVYIFKNEVRGLIVNARRLELPGGISLEIEKDIIQAKRLSIEVKNERKPEAQKIIDDATSTFETQANKRMVEVGLTPSPSGLDTNYYRKITDIDPRLALIGLSSDMEIMLKNLAKGFKISINVTDAVPQITSKLFNKGAISSRQREFITTLFKICATAAHGASITREQALEVINIADVLVKDYIAWLSWGFTK